MERQAVPCSNFDLIKVFDRRLRCFGVLEYCFDPTRPIETTFIDGNIAPVLRGPHKNSQGEIVITIAGLRKRETHSSTTVGSGFLGNKPNLSSGYPLPY